MNRRLLFLCLNSFALSAFAANRIRDLDQHHVDWLIFHDINFMSITGKRFDASVWPLADSGLLGPVTLHPLARLTTDQ